MNLKIGDNRLCFAFIKNMKVQVVFDGNFVRNGTGFEVKHGISASEVKSYDWGNSGIVR